MLRPTTTILLLATLVLAGCIQAPLPDDPVDAANLEPAFGTMTGEERARRDEASPCLGSGSLVPLETPYCARRHLDVGGEIDLARLPVLVEAGFADLDVVPAPEGSWSLAATIEARAASEESARAKLDDVTIGWSHTDGVGHFLRVAVETTRQDLQQVSVHLELALPPGVAYDAVLQAGSGDLRVEALRAESLTVETGSGDVAMERAVARLLVVETGSGDVTLADFEADRLLLDGGSGDRQLHGRVGDLTHSGGSGDVTAVLTPTRTGTFVFAAGSGDMELAVPESSRHGYDVVAQAGSGEVTVRLQDGRLDQKDDDEARFQTTDLARRAIRTTVAIDTGSGDITVGPS